MKNMNSTSKLLSICLILLVQIAPSLIADEPDSNGDAVPDTPLPCPVKTTTTREGDSVAVSLVAQPKSKNNPEDQSQDQPKNLVLEIHSRTGIGNAKITRTATQWPASVTLKLHLQGLERLDIGHAKTVQHLSVSSHSGHTISQWHHSNASEPIAAGDPYFVKIHMVPAGDRAAKVPLQGGWFEIELPAAMLKTNPEFIELKWIDFYR